MPADDQNVVQTVDLTKVYRDFWGRQRVKALDGLDLEVKRGEVFGLLGPNGSGKTTTVRLVLGLLFPTSGLVRIFGGSPRTVDVKRRVGYMPEESHLYEYLTADETLDFFGRLFGLSRGERKRRADALIEMVGLGRARRRPVGEFSKGMARRIGLAQALINDPDLLILDEPTTGLDPIGTHEMKELIVALKKRGKTIFLCSHLLADVEAVCDRICILYGGRARSLGNVSELLTSQDRLEIRTPSLPEDVIEQIRALVRGSAGQEASVEVSAPTKRLEEHFLSVVADARRERIATAGAEAGAETAAFLTAEQQGKQLVGELVSAGQEGAAQKAPVAPSVQDAGIGPDREMIEGLVAGEEAKSKQPASKGKEPKVPLDTAVHQDVIDQLTSADRETEEQERPKDSGEDKE